MSIAPARRSRLPPNEASIVGTPAVEQVAEARRVLRERGEDDAVDAARDERAALRRLDLGVAVGVGDQHGVAVAARAPHDGLRERRRRTG